MKYCFYCPSVAKTKDHVIPISKGGSIKGKTVPCCALCNTTRGNLSQEEFIRFMKFAKEKTGDLEYSDLRPYQRRIVKKQFLKVTGIRMGETK